jgi:enamine deaminase RidA (YjgF/YER057c/UK114 family)
MSANVSADGKTSNTAFPISINALASAAGLHIRAALAPAARYQLSTQIGNVLILSGQIATDADGAPGPCGQLGAELSNEAGRKAACSAALHLLAVLRDAVDDDARKVQQVLRLGVFIAADANFSAHSEVADGASEVFEQIFGERGVHARTSVGVASLPAGVAVEVDALIALNDA